MSDAQPQPRTWFSGDSSPDDQRNTTSAVVLLGLGFALLSPLSALLFGLCYFLFSRVRISHKVFGVFSAVYLAFILLTGIAARGVKWYGDSFMRILDALKSNVEVDFGFVMSTLALQLPLSVFVGSLLGFIFCWYTWLRRPVWQETKFRLTPWQWWRKRRTIRDLRENRNGPMNGGTLGVNEVGERIVQTDEEASMHTFIPGASGSGKTTTMMSQVKDHIRRGHGVAFIDLKGGTDVPEILYEYAQRHGRNFYHWLILDPREGYNGPDPDGPSYYDPLGRGDASRRKDMIIAGRKWSEDYYKTLASSYLQTAFNVAIAVPPEDGTDSLSDIISLLNPKNLAVRAERMPRDLHYEEIREYAREWTGRKLDSGAQSAIDGVMRELQVLRGSSAGKWLRNPPEGGKKINLKDIAQRGDVVVFSLDSSNYEQTAAAVANFIVQDLKTVTSELRVDPSQNPLHVYIDEFSAMDSSNVINLINKARDAKMPVTLSTQALGDLKKVDPSFLEQLLGIINAFIIHRANIEDDLEIYAGLTGKTSRWKSRYGVEHTSGGLLGGMGKGAATGAGTVEEIEDYRVTPKEIQELKRGQAIYVAMSPQQRFEKITVIPEEGKTARDSDKIIKPIALMGSNDTELGLPSLDPEKLRAAGVRRGLSEDLAASPVDEGGDDDGDEPAPLALSNIVPRKSTGKLNGRDLNAALRGEESKVVKPVVSDVSIPKLAPRIPPRPNLGQSKPAAEQAVVPKLPSAPKQTQPTTASTSAPATTAAPVKKPGLPTAPAVRPLPTKPVAVPTEEPTEKKKNPAVAKDEKTKASRSKSISARWDDVW